MHDSLDGVAAPAGACRDRTIRVDLGVLVENIFPAFLKIDEGFTTPVLGDGIRKFYQQACVSKLLLGTCKYERERTLTERRRACRVDRHDKILLV